MDARNGNELIFRRWSAIPELGASASAVWRELKPQVALDLSFGKGKTTSESVSDAIVVFARNHLYGKC